MAATACLNLGMHDNTEARINRERGVVLLWDVDGIMLVLRAVFNLLVRNARPRGPMGFRCLMFSLSGPCELLFLLCFIASWT